MQILALGSKIRPVDFINSKTHRSASQYEENLRNSFFNFDFRAKISVPEGTESAESTTLSSADSTQTAAQKKAISFQAAEIAGEIQYKELCERLDTEPHFTSQSIINLKLKNLKDNKHFFNTKSILKMHKAHIQVINI